ncbi:DUF3585 [Tritrichomonas musculus]|uniref:DUF3585 n=1 Tax=Tritrichomonas musculus TaxID=1915356 RepID=A0ABR2KZD3_9EUKA
MIDEMICGKRIIFIICKQMKRVNKVFAWAVERTEDYDNVHNFEPYDLAICALLDSYHPDKIHYSSLDPSDHTKNLELSVKTMEDLGILVYFYPDELLDHKCIDKKIMLTQIAAVKAKLEPNPIN